MADRKKIWSWFTQSEHNYFLPFVIVVTLIVGVWLVFLSHDSILNWGRSAMEVKNQEAEIHRLRSEIEKMEAQIKDLTTNLDSLEKFARERYHFAVPGEDVYIEE